MIFNKYFYFIKRKTFLKIKNINKYLYLYFLANLSAFAVGTCLGWTSPISPKLKSDDTSDSPLDHKIDATDDAWIASIVALGALVGKFF